MFKRFYDIYLNSNVKSFTNFRSIKLNKKAITQVKHNLLNKFKESIKNLELNVFIHLMFSFISLYIGKHLL